MCVCVHEGGGEERPNNTLQLVLCTHRDGIKGDGIAYSQRCDGIRCCVLTEVGCGDIVLCAYMQRWDVMY